MKKLLFLSIFVLSSLMLNVYAQDLTSSQYKLVEPTIDSVAGITESSNYSALNNSLPVSQYTVSSANYRIKDGTAAFIEANVPKVSCLETSTTSGTTDCTGVPGGDGMQGVCGTPGCYDRAKIEIDAQNNPNDTRYAIQVSTTSDFSANIYYVTPATRLLKSNLVISDFIFKCEWEGTVLSGYCGSANTTYQKFNILGLIPGVTYYARIAAFHGSTSTASFTQSEWGPGVAVTTQNPILSQDIDIAANTSTPTSAPYSIDLGQLTAGTVNTTTDYIVLKVSTNSLSGIETQVKGTNGGLQFGANLIASVDGDLGSLGSGFGMRNDSTTNSAQNTANLGSITVSTTPTDFTDTGATHRVGSPGNSFVKLFTSNNLPLHTGVSAYRLKAKPQTTAAAGNYSETLTFITFGSF